MPLASYWERLLRDYPEHPLLSKKDEWKAAIPFQLYGDEAVAMRESWMLASWSLELSKNRSNSLQSRMLLYSFPSSWYAISEDGINLSLQTLNTAIVHRFNRMGAEGIAVSQLDEQRYFYVVTLTGDWKYLKQSLNLVRHYNAEEVLQACLSTFELFLRVILKGCQDAQQVHRVVSLTGVRN